MTNQSSQYRGGAVKQGGNDRILTIDWSLLFRRLRLRFSQLFRSARHRAAQTEYTPPAWAANFRLGWFRLGLIGLLIFVFTQKQIDFTVSVGKAGLSAGTNPVTAAKLDNSSSGAPKTVSTRMSVLPASGATVQEWSVDQLEASKVSAYINRFERVAYTEAEKYGIPAQAKLAMAILESEAGTHPRTRENNNHFGSATPDGYYTNAWANWRAHSEMMSREYSQLVNYQNDLRRWVRELDNTGYSQDPQYGNKLLAIIDRFDL